MNEIIPKASETNSSRFSHTVCYISVVATATDNCFDKYKLFHNNALLYAFA